ncbi:MAG TPA: sugar phosphate nucleotidyltransferase, partial [Hanamia sp.]
DFDRYGVVELNEDYSIKLFKEKQFYKSGLINGGVYALDVNRFLKENLPEKFSFEKEFLEKNINPENQRATLFGQVQDEYFIDIGVPEDYKKAQVELVSMVNGEWSDG